MPEVWRFLKKVWKFWQVNLTGSALIAVLLLVQIFVRSVPWWGYAGVAVITLFMSCFLAWRDEYRSRLVIESSRGKEWADLSSQASVEMSFRLKAERQLEATKKQLAQAEQKLADERANKLSTDEIVLREARTGFRVIQRQGYNAVAPRYFLNETWVKMVSEKYGKTAKEIDEAIDRLDGKFHWQA